MSDFRRIDESFWAAPQIALGDVAEAKAQGFALVINNRPDGEAPEAPQGAAIEAAARAAGLDYLAIPVSPAGFGLDQVEAMAAALQAAAGPVLAYCRSGTRSTLLWSLAQARLGADPDAIAAAAAGGGYDVAPVRPLIDELAGRASG